MVLADVVKDYAQTVMLPAGQADAGRIQALFAPLVEQARADLEAEGLEGEQVELLPALDMRYIGQSYELTIHPQGGIEAGPERLAAAFHDAHRQRFSYASEGEPVEIVNLRLKAIGHTPKPALEPQPLGHVDPSAACIGYKPVFFADPERPQAARPIPTALYERARLTPGKMVVGPAVVFQMDTTTVLPPGWAGSVDGWSNLILESRS
jgi:N-methylhydantoinase A